MTYEEQVKKAYELRKEVNRLDEEKATLDAKKKELEAELEGLNSSIIESLKGVNKLEDKVDNIYVNLMKKESIGYTDPSKVLQFLEDSGRLDLIRVKKELNKVAINKAIKKDTKLNEELSSMTSKKVTEYVVVTDEENHQKMLEHLSQN